MNGRRGDIYGSVVNEEGITCREAVEYEEEDVQCKDKLGYEEEVQYKGGRRGRAITFNEAGGDVE